MKLSYWTNDTNRWMEFNSCQYYNPTILQGMESYQKSLGPSKSNRSLPKIGLYTIECGLAMFKGLVRYWATPLATEIHQYPYGNSLLSNSAICSPRWYTSKTLCADSILCKLLHREPRKFNLAKLPHLRGRHNFEICLRVLHNLL